MRITVSNLSYISGEGLINSLPVLKDISFTVENQDLFGILGPSGSGKTTLAQLMAGLLEASSGKISYSSPEGGSLPRMGMVFQNPEEQFFEDTLEMDVLSGLLGRNWDRATINEHIFRAFGWVGLDYEKFASRSPFSLSGGEKRLAAIACVLSTNPDIVLLDEPTAGLDPVCRKQIYRLIGKLNRQGKTVCIISHDLELIASLTNRLLLLQHGKILWTGKTARLFSHFDLIRKAGLELPEISSIMRQLAESDFPVNTAALSVKEAADTIINFFAPELFIKRLKPWEKPF